MKKQKRVEKQFYLPPELLVEIVLYFEINEVKDFFLVNRLFYSIDKIDYFWKKMFKIRFPYGCPDEFQHLKSWRNRLKLFVKFLVDANSTICNEKYSNNKKVFIEIVKKYPYCSLCRASNLLKDDEDVILEAVKGDGENIACASDRLKDNKRIALASLKNSNTAFEYFSDRLKSDKEVLNKAYQFGECRIRLFYNNDREFVLNAVKNNLNVYLDEVNVNLRSDREFILEFIKSTKKYFSIEYIGDNLKDDKEIIILTVSRYGSHLRVASDRLKDDREVVLAAVRQNGYSLEYANERLKDDRDVALEAAKNGGLAFVSPRLKDDREIVLAAIRCEDDNGGIDIQYASDRLKNDKSIVKEALKNGCALFHINTSLLTDEDINKL